MNSNFNVIGLTRLGIKPESTEGDTRMFKGWCYMWGDRGSQVSSDKSSFTAGASNGLCRLKPGDLFTNKTSRTRTEMLDMIAKPFIGDWLLFIPRWTWSLAARVKQTRPLIARPVIVMYKWWRTFFHDRVEYSLKLQRVNFPVLNISVKLYQRQMASAIIV